MRFNDLIRKVWNNVWRNRLRTFLTLIAVAIGCTSIIVMVSLALGLKSNAEQEIRSQGNLLEIRFFGRIKNIQNRETTSLTKADINQIKATPHITAVLTPRPLGQPAQVKFNNYQGDSMVVGINIDQYKNRPHKMYQGKYFDNTPNSIVVTYAFGEKLMSKKEMEEFRKSQEQQKQFKRPIRYINTLNKTVQLTFQKKNLDGTMIQKRIPVKVSGVLEKPENPWEEGQPMLYISSDLLKKEVIDWTGNPDGNIEPMPPSPDGRPMERPEFQDVIAIVDNVANIEMVSKSLEKEQFAFNSMYQNMKEVRLVFLIIQIVLGGIGAISLIVASIGIVNTMIMSIMERTREIGIMKVVGADLPTIRKMFLLEAGYIGLLGGLLGAGVSYFLSLVINVAFKLFINSVATAGNGPKVSDISIIPLGLVFGAVAFSFLIGLGAGYLPANRAVKLSALDAIRTD